MMAQFETVATFQDLPLAELAKAKLESEGVYCILLNKHHIGMNWMYSQALGGVKVQTLSRDANRAREILKTDDSGMLSIVENEFPEPTLDDICQKCGSTNLEYINMARTAGALTMLFSLPLIFFGIRYKCKDCGHKMKPNKQQ